MSPNKNRFLRFIVLQSLSSVHHQLLDVWLGSLNCLARELTHKDLPLVEALLVNLFLGFLKQIRVILALDCELIR